MGAWGTGIYDNDDAADWSAEVAELGLQAVEAALDAVIEAEYVEAPDAACAMAAADLVARLVSGRGENSAYCEDIMAWVEANAGPPAPSLVVKAAQAVGRVRGDDSELAELWSEDAASLAAWLPRWQTSSDASARNGRQALVLHPSPRLRRERRAGNRGG